MSDIQLLVEQVEQLTNALQQKSQQLIIMQQRQLNVEELIKTVENQTDQIQTLAKEVTTWRTKYMQLEDQVDYPKKCKCKEWEDKYNALDSAYLRLQAESNMKDSRFKTLPLKQQIDHSKYQQLEEDFKAQLNYYREQLIHLQQSIPSDQNGYTREQVEEKNKLIEEQSRLIQYLKLELEQKILRIKDLESSLSLLNYRTTTPTKIPEIQDQINETIHQINYKLAEPKRELIGQLSPTQTKLLSNRKF